MVSRLIEVNPPDRLREHVAVAGSGGAGPSVGSLFLPATWRGMTIEVREIATDDPERLARAVDGTPWARARDGGRRYPSLRSPSRLPLPARARARSITSVGTGSLFFMPNLSRPGKNRRSARAVTSIGFRFGTVSS